MATEQTASPLSETSPSVHAHLSILQSVIQRMASNSTSCKTWFITVVSAILVIVADKGKPNFAFIALVGEQRNVKLKRGRIETLTVGGADDCISLCDEE